MKWLSVIISDEKPFLEPGATSVQLTVRSSEDAVKSLGYMSKVFHMLVDDEAREPELPDAAPPARTTADAAVIPKRKRAVTYSAEELGRMRQRAANMRAAKAAKRATKAGERKTRSYVRSGMYSKKNKEAK